MARFCWSLAIAMGCAGSPAPDVESGTSGDASGSAAASTEGPGTSVGSTVGSTSSTTGSEASTGSESGSSEGETSTPEGCVEGGPLAYDGVWSDGATIVICGAGFGERPHQAEPDLLEDFSDFGHAEGETVRIGEGEVFGANTTFAYTNAADPRFAGDVGQVFADGDAFFGNANGALGGSDAPDTIDRIYGRFWKRFERGPFEIENASSHKFIRLWNGGSDDLRISWTQMHMTVGNANAGFPQSNVSWRDWEGDPVGWNLYEMLVDLETHTVRTWLNGVLVHEIVDADRIVDSAGGLRFAQIASFDASGGTPEVTEQRHWTEEVYIDGSPARVVVGDFATWVERGAAGASVPLREEIQRPTSWSDTRIELAARLGALESFEGRYLYVIADDGTVVNEDGLPLE